MNIDNLREIIFEKLNLIRVYLKPQGRKADMVDSLIIKKGQLLLMPVESYIENLLRILDMLRFGELQLNSGQKLGLIMF